MELGNLAFGISRGEFEIDRDAWCEIFEPLFDKMKCGGYLTHFENDTFKMRPYDWDAECDCGFDELSCEWWKNHPHQENCFSERIRRFDKEELNTMDWKIPWETRRAKLQEWLDKEGVPMEGCMVRCDCGVHEAYDRWEVGKGHTLECRNVQPNFLHKPTGYAFMVYKAAFRDSYANMDLSQEQARDIVNGCLRSIEGVEFDEY